jgi:hypothetical protein
MTVYVDDMRKPVRLNRFTANWSHLYADTPEELREIAEKLALKPQWLQYAGTWKEHYDVTDTVRLHAIKLGVTQVTYRETGKYMSEKRKASLVVK